MKLLNCTLVALALSATGCGSESPESPVSPQVLSQSSQSPKLQVSGTVRYSNGTAVGYAKVYADAGSSVQCDPAGRFEIVVPANGGSVTLSARDGFNPELAYAVTQFGSVRIGGSPGRITIDIVLDHSTPI